MTSAEASSLFAGAADVQSQRAVVVDLVRSKRIHDVAQDDSFRDGLTRVAQAVRASATPWQRLTAIATLERVAAVAKPLRPIVDDLLRNAIVEPLPDLQEVRDADDRLYAARSWRAVRNSQWYLDFLAAGAVREELGEAVRKECIAGLVELSTDVGTALEALATALVSMTFPTKKPGDSLGRRLKRLLSAFTDIMTTRHLPVGTQVGRSLSRLVERSAREHVRPESIGVKQDVARQTAALIHEIVRSGFSQAAESRTYEALAVVEEWFTRREWRTLCESESSVDIARVGEDIGEALLLLARLGLTDDRLRLSLQTACGSHSRADTICRRMATTIPGISRDVRDWLIGARRRVHSEHAEESQVRSVDQVLAELLIDRNRLAHASEVVKTELLPDVSTVLPQSAGALIRLIRTAGAMANKLELVKTWRQLRIRSREVGQEVEYSPREHRYRAEGAPGRRVRLISPIVERMSEDSVPQVVLKGNVEPVADRSESSQRKVKW